MQLSRVPIFMASARGNLVFEKFRESDRTELDGFSETLQRKHLATDVIDLDAAGA